MSGLCLNSVAEERRRLQLFHCNRDISLGLYTCLPFRGRILMQTSDLGLAGIFSSHISHILGHKIKMRTCDCRWGQDFRCKVADGRASPLTTSASLPCIMIGLCPRDKNLYFYLYFHPSYSRNELVCMEVLKHHCTMYMAMSLRRWGLEAWP